MFKNSSPRPFFLLTPLALPARDVAMQLQHLHSKVVESLKRLQLFRRSEQNLCLNEVCIVVHVMTQKVCCFHKF